MESEGSRRAPIVGNPDPLKRVRKLVRQNRLRAAFSSLNEDTAAIINQTIHDQLSVKFPCAKLAFRSQSGYITQTQMCFNADDLYRIVKNMALTHKFKAAGPSSWRYSHLFEIVLKKNQSAADTEFIQNIAWLIQ